MKYRLLALTAVLMMLLVGCKAETKTVNYCAKCGNVATQSLAGPAYYMTSEGIPLSKCREVVSGVYSTYVCSDCLGPVVPWEP